MVAMAPIFDTGNSLFYNKEFIPTNEYLLDITVTSFKRREVDMLQFVSNKESVNTDKLEGFAEEVENILKKYTAMPEVRAEQIVKSVEQKIEYLKLFQQGKKIWKKEKYWQGGFVSNITVMRNGETLVIGEQPRLIVNLKDQKNYIEVNGRRLLGCGKIYT